MPIINEEGLKIKNMSDVFGNLVDWITAKTDKISDFTVGSAIRTLTESIAIQFEEFYYDMKTNILYAIENSVYNAFGFEIQPATYTTGVVTVSFYAPIKNSIKFEAGTVFCTSGAFGYIYYESTKEIVALMGEKSVLIPVKCKSEGAIGNVPAGAISTMVATNPQIESVFNMSGLTNGKNIETSSERKKRFQDYIKTLARGTADSIVYGALEVEGVAGAYVDDKYIGYVKLYVHDHNGELSPELKAKVLHNVVNYRAGGIEVEVLPILKKEIDLSLTIVINNDYDEQTYKTVLQNLVIATLNEYTVSNDFYLSDIIHIIKNAYDEIVVNITVSKGKDVNVENNELVRAGKVNIKCIKLSNWRV